MAEIFVIKKDIFNTHAQLLVNPVNCVGVMGAGLAKQFKERYPGMFVKYKKDCLLGNVQLGEIRIYEGNFYSDVICFPTKYHWEDPSKLSYIAHALGRLKEVITYDSIAIPALGCGLGGLQKKEVIPMIVKYMMDSYFKTVYITLKD